MVQHNSVKTNQLLYQLNLKESYYKDCDGVFETIIHAPGDYKTNRQVWITIVKDNYWDQFFNINFQDWIDFNLQNNLSRRDHEKWQAVWVTSCHTIWFLRNQREHLKDYIF